MPAPREAAAGSIPSQSEIRALLERITRSRYFQQAQLEKLLLTHVVERALAGDVVALEESAIAAAVFGRGSAFDPNTDPVVQIAARRLRERLAAYYASQKHRNTPLRIELPRGGYAPAFIVQPAPRRRRTLLFLALAAVALLAAGAGAMRLARETPGARAYQSVAVVAPFRNLNGSPAFDHYGSEIAKAVFEGLTKMRGLRSVRQVPSGGPASPPPDAFLAARLGAAGAVVQGSFTAGRNNIELTVELLDGSSGNRLWFEVYNNPPDQIPAVESDIIYALRRALKAQ